MPAVCRVCKCVFMDECGARIHSNKFIIFFMAHVAHFAINPNEKKTSEMSYFGEEFTVDGQISSFFFF